MDSKIKKKDLFKIVRNKKWTDLTSSVSAEDLAQLLPFEEGLILSRQILEHIAWDIDLQIYALHIVLQLRNSFPSQWDASWRNDAFLGYIYDILDEYEKQFDMYEHALKKSGKNHPSLLIELAKLWSYPGIHEKKIDKKRAREILENVAEKTRYVEAAEHLRAFFVNQNEMDKASYWEAIKKDSIKNKNFAPDVLPEFIRDDNRLENWINEQLNKT